MSGTPSTKDRILASAMQLLDTGGPGAITLRAVGDASGISQSAPYRHYEDKRALLEAIVRANLDYFSEALERAKRDGAAPIEVLDRVVRDYFDFARRFPVRHRFLLEVSRNDSALGAEIRQAFGAVTALVQAAQLADEIRGGDAEQITALIFGAAYGTADLSVAAREGMSTEATPDLAPLLLDLLASDPVARR